MLFFLLCASAQAGDWERKDTWLLGGALGVLAIDWNQTRKTTNPGYTYKEDQVVSENLTIHADKTRGAYYERNPLLGSDPSIAEINRYFIVSMAATAGVAYVLPPFWRRAFLGGVIVVQTVVIIHNQSLGLQVSF